MTLAWTPPAIDPGLDDAAAWNAVVAASGEAMPLGPDGATFSYRLREPPSADAWVAAVGTAHAARPVLVHVRTFPFKALFNVELGVDDVAGLPDGLREALIEGMFAFSRGLLPQDAGELPVREQGVLAGFSALATPDIQWFAVTFIRQDGLAVELDIGCERAAAARLARTVATGAAPAQAALAQKIAVPVDTTIGAITIAHAELALLEPGAVVVMAQMPADTVRLRARALTFDFTRAEGGWLCSGPQRAGDHRTPATAHRSRNEDSMDDDAKPDETDETVALADLPVAIDFDIGRTLVPLSALSQWQSGTLVELEPPQTGEGVAVTIRANGEIVGTGDIVRIDERIAVRVTRFMLRP